MKRNNPIAFDSLLTPAFFQPPKVSIHDIKADLKFNIPTGKETLAQFFIKQEEAFLKGVAGLVDDLKTLIEKQGMLDEKAKAGLEKFLAKCRFSTNNPSLYYKDNVYPLLTQGVKELAEIIAIIKEDESWSASRKELIGHMINKFDEACEPIMNSYIHRTRLALSFDLKKQFMGFRGFLASQLAQSVVDAFNIEYGGHLDIERGSDEHYIGGMLNLYRDQLGLEVIDDGHLVHYPIPPEMNDLFVTLMSEGLNAGYIVEQIMDMYREQTYKIELNEEVISWFDKFGSDSRPIMDLIANEDDTGQVQVKPHVEHYVRNILFIRLANNGFFDLSKMPLHVLPDFPGVTIHLPSVNSILLAYVSFSEKYKADQPFVLFYVEQMLADLKHGTSKVSELEGLCSPKQLEILRGEAIRLLGADWSSKIALMSADDASLFKEYLINLFEASDTKAINWYQSWQLVLRSLVGVGHDAAHFAKGFYLAWSQGFLADDVIKFLEQHAADADSMEKLLELFHQGLGVAIDASLFALLASRKRHARKFSAYMQDVTSLDKLLDLIDANILNVESMTKLLDASDHVSDIVDTLIRLYGCDPELCAHYVTAIIQKGSNVNLLSFIRKIVEFSQEKKVPLTSELMTAILKSDARADISMHIDVPLLAVAILFKSVEVCKLLSVNGVTTADTVTIRISELQAALPATKWPALSELLQAKTGMSQPSHDGEIVVTVKELTSLVDKKEVTACFEAPKTESTATLLAKFNQFSPIITEGEERAIHPQPPGFDQ